MDALNLNENERPEVRGIGLNWDKLRARLGPGRARTRVRARDPSSIVHRTYIQSVRPPKCFKRNLAAHEHDLALI